MQLVACIMLLMCYCQFNQPFIWRNGMVLLIGARYGTINPAQ